MIDDLIDMVKYDFEHKVWPSLGVRGGLVLKLPTQQYDVRFNEIV